MSGVPPLEGELLARLSHLEPLLAGRRVLVVAPPAEGRACAAWLAARGLAGAEVAPGEEGLAGPFDGILVQPGAGGALDAGRVARLRGRLAAGGWLAASPGPGEEGAEAALREAFAAVEEAVLVPLSGFAVVPAAPASPGIVWDGTALPASPPVSRLLLCVERPSGLAGATLVALAPGALPREAPAGDLGAGAAGHLAAAREAELVSEAAALSWRAGELARALAAAESERDALRGRLEREAGDAGAGALPDLLSP